MLWWVGFRLATIFATAPTASKMTLASKVANCGKHHYKSATHFAAQSIKKCMKITWCLIGPQIMESTAYRYQILPVPLYLNSSQNPTGKSYLVVIVMTFVLAQMLLSSGHYTPKYLFTSKFFRFYQICNRFFLILIKTLPLNIRITIKRYL